MRIRSLKPSKWRVAALAAALCVVLPPLMAGAQQNAPPVPQGPPPNRRVVVDSVEVYGNYRIPLESALATFAIRPNQSVTYREIQKGTKALMATGQFDDVTVRAQDTQGDRAVLVVEVAERAWLNSVVFEGLEHANDKAIQDTTKLKAGEPFSRQEVAAAEAMIRSELAKKGIAFANIEISSPSTPDQVNTVDLRFDITEGNRITVADVTIRGNEKVPTSDIVGAMTVRPEGFFWFQEGTYDAGALATDLRSTIPDVYNSRGLLDFRILDDTLVVDPQTGKARLEMTVDEGVQYHLASFTVAGNEEFADTVLARYFEPDEGGLLSGILGRNSEGQPVFDEVAFGSAAAQVRELYANSGFLYAEVVPRFVKRPAVAGAAPTVDATWEITEGLPAYVRRVTVVGNDYTYDWVVRDHLLLLPGDRYSQARIISSYQGIGSLGFFDTQMPPPDIEPDPTTGDVDITFHVKEKQTGSINFGTSVGGGVGLSGFIGYEQPNLFGQAKAGSLRWDFGRYINNFELSFSDPSLFQSTVSGSVNLFNSRDRFFQFASGRRKRVGSSFNFGFPVPNTTRTRVFAGYSIARTKYELFEDTDDTSLFGLPPGTQSTLLLGITRNTVDHPIFPTSGTRQVWNVEMNGGLLGGSANFVKQTFEGAWWVPVGQIGRGGPGGAGGTPLTLGLTVKAGAIFGDDSAFPFDRFWMGGVQFGQSLRGYDETTITPQGYFAKDAAGIRDVDRLGDAYLQITAEYAIRIKGAASVQMFFDAGNVWSRPQDIDPTRLYRGAGIGIIFVTPFGPLGLDYAYGFDKARPGWQLHFKIGQGGGIL